MNGWLNLPNINQGNLKFSSTKAAYMKSVDIYFFLVRFSFTKIHDLQDSRGRGRQFLNSSPPLLPPSQTWTKAWQHLQRDHLCTYLAAGIEPGTFGFRAKSLITNYWEFTGVFLIFIINFDNFGLLFLGHVFI